MSSDLCPKHDLALAPDGRCVLCRRAAGVAPGPPSEESLGNRLLTWGLLLCLLSAFGGLVYIALVPAGYQGPRNAGDVVAIPAAPAPAPQRTQEASGPTSAEASAQAPAATPEPTAPAVERAIGSANEEATPTPLRRPIAPDIPPAELQSARAKVRVVMFAAPWCYICDRSRDFLGARDVTLVEHDIELHPEALDALSDLNPASTIPTFLIQDETIVGFHPWVLEDAINAAALEHYASR